MIINIYAVLGSLDTTAVQCPAVFMGGYSIGLPTDTELPVSTGEQVTREGERLLLDQLQSVRGVANLPMYELILGFFEPFRAVAWARETLTTLQGGFPEASFRLFVDSPNQVHLLKKYLPGVPVSLVQGGGLPNGRPGSNIHVGRRVRGGERPVLFFCRGRVGVRVLAPLANELRTHGYRVIFATTSNEVSDELSARGLEVTSLYRYAGVQGALEAGRTLLKGVLTPRLSPFERAIVKYRVRRDWAYDCIDRMFRVLRPLAFFTSDHASRLDNMLGQRAAVAGIPAMVLQHGVIAFEPSFRYLPFTHFLVFGEYSSEVLAKAGFTGRVISTGAPIYDPLFARKPSEGADSFREKLVVLIAGQIIEGAHTYNAKRRMLTEIAVATGRIPIKVVYRPHPAERDGLAAEILSPLNIPIDGSTGLYEAIEAADLVVTDFSTVTVEAVVLKRPVLVYQHPGRPSPVAFVEPGIVVPWCTNTDLIAELGRLVHKDQTCQDLAAGRQRFLTRHLRWDGVTATERVAHYVLEVLGQGLEHGDGFYAGGESV